MTNDRVQNLGEPSDGVDGRAMLERLLKVARVLVHYADDVTGDNPRSVCPAKSQRHESDL
jgi:hypothetical protein